jgi:hypothetical protein
MRSRRFKDAFDKLAAAEERFLVSEFLAPVVRGGDVCVRIAGVVCRLQVTPRDFTGFGVFAPTSHSAAKLVRPATLAQRKQYLQLFPLVRLILCKRNKDEWLAVAAHQGDQRFRIAGLVPVRLVEEGQQFEVIHTRFDGANFWFEATDPSRDPSTATYLRKSLHEKLVPNLLERSGLTPEERLAYTVHFVKPEATINKLDPTPQDPRDRLQDALQHSGAELLDYLERDDSYRVTYLLGGRQHVSAVRKSDLTVQVAGICLSGEDQQFDLASLVGVLREAEGTGEIVRVGDGGLEEEMYWQVHPPRNQ